MSERNCLLIVDDDQHGRDTLEMLLTPEGYQLAFAASGEEALTKAIKLQPDLILLDVMMPGMDGFEVCEHLRGHPQLEAVPIMILTALDDRDSRLRGIEAGADDFISKPFDRIELRTRVKTVVRLNRYRRLLAQRSSFEWAVEQSDDGYLLLSAGQTIHYANSCARLYLGVLDDNRLSIGFWSLLTQQHYQPEPESAWQNWPESNVGASPRYLVRPETPHVTARWLHVDILELPSADNMTNQLVRLRDVSDKMNLIQQQWTFQSLVSHKLRAPLNGLVSLQILGGKHVDLNSERAQSLLAIARESAKRLQDQIIDILRYIDSSQLIQQQVAQFPLAQLPQLLNQIETEVDIQPVILNMPPTLNTVSLAMSNQVIELMMRELFTNAKKFHPQNVPTIDISLTQKEKDKIILAVRDDGRHLSPEELSKLGIPFYQQEKYFTGEVKGMGLGLAMITKLVWSCGGHYRLTNRTDGPGLLIEFSLPVLEST